VNAYTKKTRYYFVTSSNALRLDENQLIRNLGYNANSVPLYIQQAIAEFIPAVQEKIHPQCEILIVQESDVSFNKNSIKCGKVQLNTQSLITKRLRTATAVVFFVCTIGNQVEEWSKSKLNNGDVVSGFIIDQIGSELVERLADWMETQLDTIIAPLGWKRTNRYSPGYCGWSVGEQKKLFSFFSPRPCGITLTESALMIPIKSISGIIGIGPNAVLKDYECSLCELENCYQRRHRT
jgi:hypothetical protein